MTQAYQPNLGQIVEGTAFRDAVHIAVAPVVAGQDLSPGQRVLYADGVAMGTEGEGTGVVDPFLRGPVLCGSRFWMFLHPNSISYLRHAWQHAAFKVKAPGEGNPHE